MNYFGIYHSSYSRSCGGICEAPCITKGRMMLCAEDIASEEALIAMARGRIRNLSALAAELGCEPEPGTVVLRAYRKWAKDYPRHIEGPAMTCAMDTERDELILSRDRMGEQPLFYALQGSRLLFSDHPDSILKYDSGEALVDADGLRELFGMGPAHTPGRTFYRNINELEPGCALHMGAEGLILNRYFNVEAHSHDEDEAATVSHARALLEQCVEGAARLNPGVMLSGGLDSTVLTALLAHKTDRSLLSFSVDYQNNARDFQATAFRPEMDAPYVMEAVRAFGTQHRTVTLDQPSLAEALDRAVSLRGFPGMADIDTSLLLFSREISRYTRSVVSGECGDEVFGGYPWFRGEAPLEGFPWSGSMDLRESLLLPDVRDRLQLSEYVRDVFETRKALADPGPMVSPKERRLMILQKLCFEFFMPNLQERATRMCEGAGVRVLTPLCDDRLVQYIYSVPWEMKFMGGQEKGLFRAAMADLLPEKLLRRTKSPYPKTCSPEYSRIVRAMALRLSADKTAPIFEIINRRRFVELAESELNPGQTPWYGQLMAGPQMLGYLWQVNRWLRERHIRIKL